MRVLLVHDYGTPTGGAELQMLALRRLLRARGHEARLFSSSATLVPGEVQADDVCRGSGGRLQVLTQTLNPSAWLNLRRVLREFRPDVVHVRMFLWQLSPLVLPLLRGYPALLHTATYKCICPTGFKLLPDGAPCSVRAGLVCLRSGCVTPQTWTAAMTQLALFHRWRPVFGSIVALSRAMADVLERDGLGPIEVVHNSVAERPVRPPLPDEPVIGYAGRLSREKGVDVLLDAVARLQARGIPGRLIIAGEGPERGRLQDLARALGLAGRISWLGHMSREGLERAFEGVWVQVVPSRWSEAFGNVATEAAMRGTAVVASNMGGLAEIVEDGTTGVLVPAGDPQALAAAIERFVVNKALAEEMGGRARARALEQFSEEAAVSSLLRIYTRLIRAQTPVHA